MGSLRQIVVNYSKNNIKMPCTNKVCLSASKGWKACFLLIAAWQGCFNSIQFLVQHNYFIKMIRGPQSKTSTPTFLHYPFFASLFCLERLLIWSLWDQLPVYSMFTKDFQQFSLKIRRRRRRRRWSVVSMNLQGHCGVWCFFGPSWGNKNRWVRWWSRALLLYYYYIY